VRRVWFAVFVMGWVWGSAKGASAEEPARIVFVPPACESLPFDVDAFLSILRIELVDTTVEKGDLQPENKATSRLSLAVTPCEGTRVNVEYRSPGHQPTHREVELADVVSRGRARALALAAAESVRSAVPDAASPERPPLPPVPPPDPGKTSAPPVPPQTSPFPSSTPEPQARVTRRRDPLQFNAGFVLRTYPVFPLVMLGGRVGMNARLGHVPLRARVDAMVLSGSVTDPLGKVNVLTVSGGLGLTFTTAWRSLGLEIGPRVEVGGAQIQGQSEAATTQASSGGRLVGAASILGVLSTPLGLHLRAEMRLELGETFHGLDALADTRKVAGVDGPLLGISLGLAYAL
jgi:hypothetical protein